MQPTPPPLVTHEGYFALPPDALYCPCALCVRGLVVIGDLGTESHHIQLVSGGKEQGSTPHASPMVILKDQWLNVAVDDGMKLLE
jgi:hypothetical protein